MLYQPCISRKSPTWKKPGRYPRILLANPPLCLPTRLASRARSGRNKENGEEAQTSGLHLALLWPKAWWGVLLWLDLGVVGVCCGLGGWESVAWVRGIADCCDLAPSPTASWPWGAAVAWPCLADERLRASFSIECMEAALVDVRPGHLLDMGPFLGLQSHQRGYL